MRVRRSLGALLLGALVVSTACAEKKSSREPTKAKAPIGPRLVISRGPSKIAPATSGQQSQASVYALATLSDPTLVTLGTALDDLALDVALKQNPMVDDLRADAGAPEHVLRAMLETDASRISVARALAAGVWQSGDGELSVRVVPECEDDRESRCVALWPAPDDHDPEADRARFLAWPLAHAAILRATSGETAQGLARRLRITPVGASSSEAIALVLTRKLDTETREAIDEVRRAASDAFEEVHSTKNAPEKLPTLLDELAHADEVALETLPIADDEVLIVPAIHAVGDPASFERAIVGRLKATGSDPSWAHAPQ